jgi:hypothetical protein
LSTPPKSRDIVEIRCFAAFAGELVVFRDSQPEVGPMLLRRGSWTATLATLLALACGSFATADDAQPTPVQTADPATAPADLPPAAPSITPVPSTGTIVYDSGMSYAYPPMPVVAGNGWQGGWSAAYAPGYYYPYAVPYYTYGYPYVAGYTPGIAPTSWNGYWNYSTAYGAPGWTGWWHGWYTGPYYTGYGSNYWDYATPSWGYSGWGYSSAGWGGWGHGYWHRPYVFSPFYRCAIGRGW